jgi:hypothetical protein
LQHEALLTDASMTITPCAKGCDITPPIIRLAFDFGSDALALLYSNGTVDRLLLHVLACYFDDIPKYILMNRLQLFYVLL